MTDAISTDAVIIGAGPCGLFAVFQLGLIDVRCHVIDSLAQPGGQCMALYPDKPIYDIPALPVVTGAELTERLLAQAKPFAPQFHFGQRACALRRLGPCDFIVDTDGGLSFRTRVVVIAAGAGAFQPRTLPLPGIAAYENVSVFHALTSPAALAGQDVLIVGGGEQALDAALTLAPLARNLTLLHRRDDFRAAPQTIERMRELVAAGRITLRRGQVASLTGVNGRISAATVTGGDGARFDIACTALLPLLGLTTALGPLAEWGLELQENQIPVDAATFATAMTGVFAIGDINHYPGKLKLILSGFHEAALMAQEVFRLMQPGERQVQAYTSTSSGLQKKLGLT